MGLLLLSGLPDGLFSNQKSQVNFGGPWNRKCCYVYFMTICNLLHMAIGHNVWQFGVVCRHLLYFYHFGMFGPRKIWQPWLLYNSKESAAGFLNVRNAFE
jgi:hypothetical protein